MDRSVAAVVIGRNEGKRLQVCIASLVKQDLRIVYVDSGSTDTSVEWARSFGAEVLELDLSTPFTAARARNAGFAHACEVYPDAEFIQVVDGDCEIDGLWVQTGLAALAETPRIAVVFGHQRERFPDASIWNRLIDDEWKNAPLGEVKSCGGNALMRRAALEEVGGYRSDLIAGEEPEMCYRMRQNGWTICRIDAEMALHDADMMRIGQWWQRNRRGGHTYAEGVALHGAEPERYHVQKLTKTLFWGAGIPIAALLGSILFGVWGLLVLLAWPLQVLRLTAKGMSLDKAFFMTFGKIPESQGALTYWLGRLFGRQRRTLIEYK